ncbi:MAG: hypothetical protein IJ385_06760 [Ruminiclostridium sp.]|nr:hypothetical protein [Ruminiclostridium sp.]
MNDERFLCPPAADGFKKALKKHKHTMALFKFIGDSRYLNPSSFIINYFIARTFSTSKTAVQCTAVL